MNPISGWSESYYGSVAWIDRVTLRTLTVCIDLNELGPIFS